MGVPAATEPPSTSNPAHPASIDAARGVEAVRALARASRLLERASDELNLAQYRVLAAVASGAERSSRIATRLAIGKPTVSAMVESLRQRGLLARTGVEGDQRVAALHLTPDGEAALERVEAAMIRRLGDVCDRTPDREQLLESLVWMGAAIDELAAERHAQGGR